MARCLVDFVFELTIRLTLTTGACNVVMLGGVCYANALGSFLQYVPNDAACGAHYFYRISLSDQF